jgi:hypothetical protein
VKKIKIHKYWLQPLEGNRDLVIEIDMPYEAQLLDVGFTGPHPVIWAMFDVENEKRLVRRRFHVVMTGEEYNLPYNVKFFRTLQHPRLDMIFHIFHEAW